MSVKIVERSVEVIERQIAAGLGRPLKLGEVVQEGDLLLCLPDDHWIPATAIGLIVSECDVGWYRRPAQPQTARKGKTR